MKFKNESQIGTATLVAIGIGVLTGLITLPWDALAAPRGKTTVANAVDATQREAESQIRRLLEPLLDKYCHDECKLMSVTATVDVATPDQIAPGFDDGETHSTVDLAPSSGTVKILMDEKVGPISRGKLLELLQQFLDTLEYPVKIDTQIVTFPQPMGSVGKVTELREKITKQFTETVQDLFSRYCPETCLLADYDLQTENVNPEEAQYGSTGEFVQDSGTAIRIKNISANILVDESLTPEERVNIIEMAKLKTNFFRNVTLTSKSMRFPRPSTDAGFAGGGYGQGGGRGLASQKTSDSVLSDSKFNSTSTNSNNSTNSVENRSNNNSTNTHSNNETSARQEKFERVEKIERVESGDAVQAELQKFKVYGLVLTSLVLALLVCIAFFVVVNSRQRSSGGKSADSPRSPSPFDVPGEGATSSAGDSAPAPTNFEKLAKRYESDRLQSELLTTYTQYPRVAKQVFSRVLTEEGVETTSQYVHIFGETIVMDMLRDPSLQADLAELMDYYAKNTFEIDDAEKLELLQKLHNRTVAGKLFMMGSRSSNLFDFLAEMDGTQILELIRNESLTVKAIVLTQCDPQKRAAVYGQMDEDTRMKLMTELTRIDYLPRDYIFNVANALKRKRRDNPKLNTEALPGSDVLLTLLERTPSETQRSVIQNLELANPDSARTLKSKMVCLDTLRFLRDGQLLEVVLSLKHDELLQFLKGTPANVKAAIMSKTPKDLSSELEEELETVQLNSREAYSTIERKIINRMKMMANEGLINLVETNDRMLTEGGGQGFGGQEGTSTQAESTPTLKKVAGW